MVNFNSYSAFRISSTGESIQPSHRWPLSSLCAAGLAWFVPMAGDAIIDSPLKEIQKHIDSIQDSLSTWYHCDKKVYQSRDDIEDKENKDDGNRSGKCGSRCLPYCICPSQVMTVMPASIQVFLKFSHLHYIDVWRFVESSVACRLKSCDFGTIFIAFVLPYGSC